MGIVGGLAVWALLFVIIPDGFMGLPNRPVVVADGELEIRSIFGTIMAVVTLFAFPVIGAVTASETASKA